MNFFKQTSPSTVETITQPPEVYGKIETITAVGARLRRYECCKLDLQRVTAICVWQNLVVTSSYALLKLWTPDGNPINFSYRGWTKLLNNIRTLTVWNDDILVVGNDSVVQYWKLTKETGWFGYPSIQLSCSVQIQFASSLSYTGASIAWGSYLHLTKREQSIEILDMKGDTVNSIPCPGMQIKCMTVFQDRLWIGSYSLSSWKIEEVDGKIEYTDCRKMKGHTGAIHALCAWNGTRMASASEDCSARVWDENGNCLFTFKTERMCSSLAVWRGKLVCGTHRNVGNKSAMIYMWNWNGTLFNSIELEDNVYSLLAYQNKLWQGSERALRFWMDPREKEWEIERVIWIALKKNNPTECPLATLPSDIVHVVFFFLYL